VAIDPSDAPEADALLDAAAYKAFLHESQA